MNDTAPESVTCETCGGTAPRTKWGGFGMACYRCGDCHAGGHIAFNRRRPVRRGGVFRPLNNRATRGVDHAV